VNDAALFKPAPESIQQRPLSTASKVLMGGPVVLVTSSWRGRTNVMPLAWHMPISSDPALIAIAIEQSRYSVDMIDHAEEFALNIPKRPLLHHVQYLGALSGEHVDKLEAAQLAHFAPSRVTAPLIEGCAAWIEAGVRDQFPFGDHVLYIAEVMAVHVDPASFDEHWRTDTADDRPLVYLGGRSYSSLDHEQEARPPTDLEAPERILAERMEEELELTTEARERRKEIEGQLADEVQRGNIVDVADLAAELNLDDADQLDLSGGVVLGGPD